MDVSVIAISYNKLKTGVDRLSFPMEALIELIYAGINQLALDNDELDIPEDCKSDIKLSLETISELMNGSEMSSWQKSYLQNALLPMIDASAKLPPLGILRGHAIVFGQYKECMLAKQQLPNSTRLITGSYVRIFIDRKLRNYNARNACKFSPYNIGDPSFDVCLPSSCDNYNTLMTLSRSLIQFNGSSPVCTVKQTSVRLRPLDCRTWTVLAVLALTIMTAIFASVSDFLTIHYGSNYHMLSSIKTGWFDCLMAFSLIRNTKDILNIEPVNKPGQIGPIYFMRFISIVWVIFGHATASYMRLSSNSLDCMDTFKSLWAQFLTNAFFSVDTFFFMSGLLVSYVWFKEYRKNKKIATSPNAWLMFYIHRLIRLSSPYYIALTFYSFVFKSFLVDTPFILLAINDSCDKNWWINFLYLNNFIHYSDQCYMASWYLATDFQLHIFAPVLLIPLALKPTLGYIIAGLLLIFSTVANLVTVYIEYFPPTYFFSGAMDPRMGPIQHYSLLIYYAPWIRCQVYIIGILVGYLFQTVETIKLSKLTNIIGWIISLILGLLVIMSLRDWMGYNIVLNLSVRAFYSALSKLAWSFAVAYITIACFYGYGGLINDFMSLSIWKPLGRLAYCAYLTHFIVIMYMLSICVNELTFSSITHTFIVFTLPCCIISWFFAYWLSILFELPASKLEMILLSKFSDKSFQTPVAREISS